MEPYLNSRGCSRRDIDRRACFIDSSEDSRRDGSASRWNILEREVSLRVARGCLGSTADATHVYGDCRGRSGMHAIGLLKLPLDGPPTPPADARRVKDTPS